VGRRLNIDRLKMVKTLCSGKPRRNCDVGSKKERADYEEKQIEDLSEFEQTKERDAEDLATMHA